MPRRSPRIWDRLRRLEALAPGGRDPALGSRPRPARRGPLRAWRHAGADGGDGDAVCWRADLAELFAAYGAATQRGRMVNMTMPARRLVTAEAALQRLSQPLTGRDWHDLAAFLPDDLGEPLLRRSAVAASLIASLELARQGEIELRQAAPFGAIMIRRRP